MKLKQVIIIIEGQVIMIIEGQRPTDNKSTYYNEVIIDWLATD